MNGIKSQIQQIFTILEKIDTNITNSNLTAVDKIINTIISKRDTDELGNNLESIKITNIDTAANIILEKAAITARDVVNTAAINASKLIVSDTNTVVSDTTFDINMYIKCLIHEIRIPITNITLGINSIENNIIDKENKNEILNTIHEMNKSLEYLENVLTKFCVIKNGK
jgi:hypothetical protein